MVEIAPLCSAKKTTVNITALSKNHLVNVVMACFFLGFLIINIVELTQLRITSFSLATVEGFSRLPSLPPSCPLSYFLSS